MRLAGARTGTGLLRAGFSWRLGAGLSLGPGMRAALAVGSGAVDRQRSSVSFAMTLPPRENRLHPYPYFKFH